MPTLLAWLHVITGELLLFAAAGLAVSGLDDLFIDTLFFTRAIWRRLTVYRRHDRAVAEAMRRADPGPIAIIVPAWDESAVIGAMLTDLTKRLDYPDYRVFIGVYPNDPATLAAITAVGDARIEAAMCANPGPTTKADALNHCWDAVLACETTRGRAFKAIVLHDAEDVVDAHELTVFDALIPRLDMVQLPVLPTLDPKSRWIGGHYLDEFAEHHTKDVMVREAIGAAVPSAGVASGIARAMMGRIADAAGGSPFDAGSLTEDYELGHRIKALGGRAALVRVRAANGLVVASRGHFPATLSAAVRQKARWLTGISLAGWDRIGWPGGWADRYMLLRDRKALASSLLVAAGYFAALLVGLDWLLRQGLAEARTLPPLTTPLLRVLLLVNAALLLWRLAMRSLFAWRAYGWREGLRAVPRGVVCNLVNGLAAWRAAWRYRRIVRGETALRWEKTAHTYPGEAR